MAKLIEGLKARASRPATSRPPLQRRAALHAAQGWAARHIGGYRVVNQVRLTVREVKRLGEVLDQAIALGANQINSIGFDVANAETLKDEARKQAMANARRRAELYATAAGAQLGQVLRISERERRSTRCGRWRGRCGPPCRSRPGRAP